jgi:hypothetical protein
MWQASDLSGQNIYTYKRLNNIENIEFSASSLFLPISPAYSAQKIPSNHALASFLHSTL